MRGGLKKTSTIPKVPTPVVDPDALPVGAVLGVKCRRAGELPNPWITLGNGTKHYILKGSRIEFQADVTVPLGSKPASIRAYQNARWSGTAALAAGIGKSKTVTFSINSGNVINGKTVIVSLGGQSVQVEIITFTLNIDSTPEDNFNGRSQTDLGVDEHVRLGFNTTPANISAADAGGLQWRFPNNAVANRDTLGLLVNTGTYVPVNSNNGTARFVAPCRTHGGDAMVPSSKEVTLELAILGGASQGLTTEKKFIIHKPDAHMVQSTVNAQVHHWNLGTEEASAGFHGTIFLTPKNVSFRTLRWSEGAGTMKTWGVLLNQEEGNVHTDTAFQDATHGTVNDGDLNTGCTVNQVDNVHSGGTYTPTRYASTSTVVGFKEWPVIWKYTYKDYPAGSWATNWIKMQKAIHKLTVYQDGRATIFKGHPKCAGGHCMKEISVEFGKGVPHFWP